MIYHYIKNSKSDTKNIFEYDYQKQRFCSIISSASRKEFKTNSVEQVNCDKTVRIIQNVATIHETIKYCREEGNVQSRYKWFD